MFNYKNAFWTLLIINAVVLGYLLLQSEGGSRSVVSSKVAFVTGGPDDYWLLTAAGAQKAAREFNMDLELMIPEKSEDLSSQMQVLTKLEPSKLAGVAISPIDAGEQTLFINRLADETTVITFDSDAPLSNRHGYVGTSNFGAGQKCAKLVHEAVPQGGKVAVIMANETKANLIERRKGFEYDLNRLLPGDSGEEPQSYEVVGFLVDNGDNERSATLIEQTLAEHPDLACLVGFNAQHGPILLQVLEKLDKVGKVKLVTFDEEDETLDGIASENVFATVAQDPYMFGYEAVRIISDQKKLGIKDPKQSVRRGSWTVPSEVVTKENLATFREEIQSLKQEAASIKQ